MDPAEWALTVRRMPDEHGATKAFTFDYAPYEREPFLECLNPRNQEVVLQMFSRGGKSEIVLNVLGYTIHQRPCRIGVCGRRSARPRNGAKTTSRVEIGTDEGD
jgi:phage terminase large subunit GpA-like protein